MIYSDTLKKLTIKFLIDKISKRLLKLQFKENRLMKSKCLEFIVKKYCHQNQTWKPFV